MLLSKNFNTRLSFADFSTPNKPSYSSSHISYNILSPKWQKRNRGVIFKVIRSFFFCGQIATIFFCEITHVLVLNLRFFHSGEEEDKNQNISEYCNWLLTVTGQLDMWFTFIKIIWSWWIYSIFIFESYWIEEI